MGQQAVERRLGKLLTDENFRERFFASPEAAIWEAVVRFAEAIDKRISRASLDPRTVKP